MSIYKKLHTIQSKINGLGKDKKTNTYSYVTGDKLLGFIKPLMNELGILLKQEVLSIENERIDYQVSIFQNQETKQWSGKPKSEVLSKVMMKFTWVDSESGEKDENLFGANGQNDWDKGVGSALTYGERYFLLKYFHIPMDEDDVDNDLRKKAEETPTDEDDKKTETSTPATNNTKTPNDWLLIGSKEWKDLLEVVTNGKTPTLASIQKKFKVRPEVKKELETLNIF